MVMPPPPLFNNPRLSQQQPSASLTALNQQDEMAHMLNQSLPAGYPYMQPKSSTDYADMMANYGGVGNYQTMPTAAQRSSSYHHHQSHRPSSSTQHNLQHNQQIGTELNMSFNLIENDIKEIRDYLRHTRKKLESTDAKAKQTNEWKQVALVLDRTLFFIYIIAIIVSVIAMFPR